MSQSHNLMSGKYISPIISKSFHLNFMHLVSCTIIGSERVSEGYLPNKSASSTSAGQVFRVELFVPFVFSIELKGLTKMFSMLHCRTHQL